ncbi:MAG: hypothetical protein ACYTG5_09215 [Planctomycetota bacterium]|jgi:hypothetical protein
MIGRVSTLLLAAGLYLLAVLGPGPQRQAPEDLMRDLMRPLILPQLWQGLQESQQGGNPVEWAARARLLTEYIPDWVDGIVYFAWESSRPPAGRRSEPELALAYLLSSLSWLDDAVAELATEKPSLAGEILLAQAFLVESRSMQDPQLGELMRERFGRDPSAMAAEYLDRAITLAPSQSKTEQRILVIPRLIAGALRMNDLRAAKQLTDAGLARLAGLEDRELAANWSGSLTRFRAFLDGDPSRSIEDLAKDPFLTDIVEAYQDR